MDTSIRTETSLLDTPMPTRVPGIIEADAKDAPPLPAAAVAAS